MVGLNRGSDKDPNVALLHPRRLSVYALVVQKGKTADSHVFSLAPQYQFNLSRSAFSLTVKKKENEEAVAHAARFIDWTLRSRYVEWPEARLPLRPISGRRD